MKVHFEEIRRYLNIGDLIHTHTSIVPCTRIRGDEGQIPKHYVRKLGESCFRHLFPKMQTFKASVATQRNGASAEDLL